MFAALSFLIPEPSFLVYYIQGTSLDFTEDPFKDYRYEDTFNIEDPFEEDKKPEVTNRSGKDPFSPVESKNFNNNAISNDKKNKNAVKTEELEPVWFAFEEGK